MSHYLDAKPSAARVWGLQPITLWKNSPYFHSSFYAELATIPFLAETISVIYYARNGCDEGEIFEKS